MVFREIKQEESVKVEVDDDFEEPQDTWDSIENFHDPPSDDWDIVEHFGETSSDDWDNVENFGEPPSADWDTVENFEATSDEEKKRPVKKRKEKSTVKCCMCAETFDRDGQLRSHCELIHPNGIPEEKLVTARHIYECTFCRRKFRMKRFLREHYLAVDYVEPEFVPESKKSYKNNKICSVCGITLYDQKSLEMHEATKHSTARNFKCDVAGCKSKFAHESGLRKHHRSFHSEKKYM